MVIQVNCACIIHLQIGCNLLSCFSRFEILCEIPKIRKQTRLTNFCIVYFMLFISCFVHIFIYKIDTRSLIRGEEFPELLTIFSNLNQLTGRRYSILRARLSPRMSSSN